MINNCKAILAERHCSFRASDCSASFYEDSSSTSFSEEEECLFGYKKDSMGCVMDACICNTESEGEVHYGDIVVNKKMQTMMAAPDNTEDMRAADISVARWTQYKQGEN